MFIGTESKYLANYPLDFVRTTSIKVQISDGLYNLETLWLIIYQNNVVFAKP